MVTERWKTLHVEFVVHEMPPFVLGLGVGLMNGDQRVADVNHGYALSNCQHHEIVVVASSRNDDVRQPMPRKLVLGDYKVVHGAPYV